MNNTPEVDGTPLEKMVLMLNDKIDALHARTDEVYRHIDSVYRHIDSSRHVIPWADVSPQGIGTISMENKAPACIDEWVRRGWDVWRVTMPCEPDSEPEYEITNRRIRGDLPTIGLNRKKYLRILESGIIHNGIVWEDPIVRELLTGDDDR